MSSVIHSLQERGLIDSISHEQIEDLLGSPQSVYVGFDATADSLHLGNLMGIIVLKWFEKHGHRPVVLLGGATSRIGDPSGKSKERPLLTDQQIIDNTNGIKKTLERFFDFGSEKNALIVNNYDWFKEFSFIGFLRDVGKHARLSTMLAKESVKTRLDSEEGMSFTEFSYQLLQGYDFLHLLDNYKVAFQAGGSDQWGNITAGIHLVRRLKQKTVYGLTFPLLTRSDGKKFGKSEEGAIWLNKEKCSYYQFYQYFISIPDEDVITMLKRLTFMPLEEVAEIEASMKQSNYVPNTAQKILASEVTKFVHGNEGLKVALEVTQAAKIGDKGQLDINQIKAIKQDFPSTLLQKNEIIGKPFAQLFLISGLTNSKSDAIRLIKNNGAYVNNQKLSDAKKNVSEDDLIENTYIVLGAGKKKKLLVELK